MTWQYSPFVLPLAIGAVFLGFLAMRSWRRRRVPGVFLIFVFFISAALWTAAYAVSMASADLSTALIMNALEYPGIVAIPVEFLLFALWYTEQDHRPSRLFLMLISVIPVVTVILVITNNFHHLFYTGFSSMTGLRGSTIWIFERGPLYWMASAYAYVLVLTGIILFLVRYRTVGAFFRAQIGLILLSVFIPLVASVLYLLDLTPFPGFDWIPLSLPVSGLAVVTATLYFELFSLHPLTHSLLVTTMQDAVIATNASGRVTLVNPAGFAILGMTEDEAIGKELAGIRSDLGRFLVSGKSSSGTVVDEVVLAVGGSPRVFEVRSVAIVPGRDQEGGYILTFRDVTERKRAESAFQTANRKLNLLSSIVRHDIRNRLTAILIYLDLAHEIRTEKDLRSDLQKIRESADGIRALVDFTQQYQDLGVEAPSWQEVGEVLRKAESQLKPDGVRIIDETGGMEILADRLFAGVIYNLLDNALRYATAMTLFRIRYERDNGRAVLFVEDDGPGIPAGEKDRIFDRGFGKNTGLGLFLAKEILGITGISIRETGVPGQGARFEMTIPAGAFRFPEPPDTKNPE